MSDCIFCKIVDKEIPSGIVYEDEHAIVFKDINPLAPVHLLVVPKKHIESLQQASPEDVSLLGHLLTVARQVAEENGVAESGYRVITNIGADGGQVVKHLHFHVLGGKTLGTKLD